MTPSPHQQSRRMALCGLMAALSLVVLLMGGLIPLATFACPMLAMICLLPVLRECGAGLCLVLYAAVSVLALLLVPDKELAAFYLFFGFYPALRPELNRLPGRFPRTAAKCGVFTASMVCMYLLLLKLFRLEAVAEEFAGYSPLMTAGLLLLGNVTLLLFDRALDRLALLYERKLRGRFFR